MDDTATTMRLDRTAGEAAGHPTSALAEAVLRRLLPVAGRGIIFAGHGVARGFTSRKVEKVHLPFEDFAAIVALLKRLDYDFLAMDQVVALSRNGFRHRKHWVHLTFDDGYQNNFDVIYPFLKERGIPFSVFVSTHYVETRERFPTFMLGLAQELGLPLAETFAGADAARTVFDKHLHYASFDRHREIEAQVKSLFPNGDEWASPDWYNDAPIELDDLKAMARDPLVHIGSHSHHHIIYHDGQDPSVARENLAESLRLLTSEWGVSGNPTFCYPNGDWAPQWAEMVRELGFPLGFPNITGFVDKSVSPMMMPRFWLSTQSRALLTCTLSVFGNQVLRLFGRLPPSHFAKQLNKRRSPSPKRP